MSGNEITTVDTGPSAIVAQYLADFQLVLPSTFRPETFVRLAQGTLRRDPDLRQAAENNPASLLVALLDCARLGHEPGTDDYYLTVRKRKGRPEVKGIEGYKGIGKRILQHPKVLSVVAEVVYSEDVFQWVPGEMERPSHRADWFGNRGPAIGAYAYAVLDGNATSKVVVIGPKEIAEAETASDARYEGRPWQKRRDAMIRKTALRRLEPFVPKASEVLAAQRERAVVASEVAAANDLPELPPVGIDAATGEIVDGELVDAFPDEGKP